MEDTNLLLLQNLNPQNNTVNQTKEIKTHKTLGTKKPRFSRKMTTFLKTSSLIVLFIAGILTISYGLSVETNSNENNNNNNESSQEARRPIKYDDQQYFYAYQHQSQHGQNDNHLSDMPPKIGVFLKNFAGEVIQQIQNEDRMEVAVGAGDGYQDSNNLVVTLPHLKVEDHIWEGKSIILECESNDYPVMWDYHGVGHPKVRISSYRRAPDYYNETSYTYGASVTFPHTDYRQTGEYSCVGAGQRLHSYSSVFAFVPGKKNLFVANDGQNETLTVHANEDNPWVTLPCVVSVKNAMVKLFVHSANGRLEQMNPSESVTTFDPTEGFRLKWKGMRSPWREYVCRGEYQSTDGDFKFEKLHLRLKPPTKKYVSSVFGGNDQQDSTSVKFGYTEQSELIHCCSADSTRQPQMKLTSCTSISDCFVARRVLGQNDGTGGDNYCPGTHCDDSSFVKVNETCVGYELLEMDHSGILDCKVLNESEQTILQFSFGVETGLVTDFLLEGKETNKILTIGREESSNRNESTTKAIYFCNPNPFFFSHGIKWAFLRGNNPNGPLEFVQEKSFPARPSIEVDEATDINMVYCFAPVWDSPNQWRNISMQVPR